MNTITRRIATAVAGPAIAAGFIAAGIAAGAPAHASPQDPGSVRCTTATVSAASAAMANPLTRAAQVGAVEGRGPAAPAATSCISH